jgi:hypothetical protein
MHIHEAVEEFRRALQSVDGQAVDPMTAEWSAIERGLARLLGGAFDLQNPNHRGLAFLVAAALGERLARDLGGFWFPNRAAPAGAAIGFADAVIVISPLELALQALGRAQLSLFDQVKSDLGEALTQARVNHATNLGASKLQPDDYRRLFDPGLLQFVVLEPAAAEAAWSGTAAEASRDLLDALGRLPARVPKEVREQLKSQLVGTLQRLDPNASLASQIAKVPSLVELLGLLYGEKASTRLAPAELWQDVLFPLLHIGAARDFPPLEDDEVDAYRKGADPLLIFVETVPFQTPAADEDGLLGVFPPESISPVSPAFQGVPTASLLRASPEPLAKLCEAFDGEGLRSALERFAAYLVEKAGSAPAVSPDAANGPTLREVSLALIAELADVVKTAQKGPGILCLRRATEAEAASQGSIAELRDALQAPRIILG